jgi:autotransporter-associated beta strand protein
MAPSEYGLVNSSFQFTGLCVMGLWSSCASLRISPPLEPNHLLKIHKFLGCFITVLILHSLFVASQARAQVIRVHLMGQNSLFSEQDSQAIAAELNSILAVASGYEGSSAVSTVLGGRTLAEGLYHPTHREVTRTTLSGVYNYLIILPETAFLATYPESVFEGVLQMSRRALNVGAIPLVLMPGKSSTEISSFGPELYRIANGCGIDAIPGGYAAQSGELLAPSSALDLKRRSYLLAATIFTKITGRNAATGSRYIPSESGIPIDPTSLANVASSSVGTHLNTVHYTTSRETIGRVRYRPIIPANNTVRYAWTGSSTETGIRDFLTPMLIASGYAVAERKVSAAQGWDAATLEAAKPIFDVNPNQYLFAYGRTGAINLAGSELINYKQANLIPFNFDRHYDGAGVGAQSINTMLDDVYWRTNDAEQENRLHGWAAIPFHLGIARLNDLDPTILFSNDGTHVTSPLYNMMASMMATSALGRDPSPTTSILASPQDLRGFNVGRQIIKQMAFLAESESFVPDTKLSIVGTPSIGVVRALTVDHTFTATDGTPPYTWTEQSPTGLPPGLTLSASGRLRGVTSANVGSWKLVLHVRDSMGAIRKLPQNLVVTALPAGTSASLNALTPSAGIVGPIFDSNLYSYSAVVGPETSSLTLTPVATDSTARIRVNGAIVTSGSRSGAISLNFGPNEITTEVVSQNQNETKTYTLTVTRSVFSTNANLVSLAPSSGTLNPVFQENVLNYTATVSDLTQITVTPTSSDAYAIIRVNGQPVTSGASSLPISLITGANPITVEVQSSDLSVTRTYRLEVTREITNLRWWDGGTTNIAALGDGISQGGASGLWNTTTQNWDQGNGKVHVGWDDVGAKTAIFGGTPGTVTTQNVTVGGMIFTSAYTLNSGNITLAGPVTISNTAAVNISSAVGGAGPLTKDGVGVLTLSSASNAYSSGTQVAAGRLILEGNLAGGPSFSIAPSATLELKLSTDNNQFFQGIINGGGSFVKSGTGRLLFGAQNNPQTIAMTSGALLDLQAGLIRNEWGNSAWTNNLSDLNVASGAIFDVWDGSAVVDALTGAGLINKAWSGTSALTIGADQGSGTFSGRISNTNQHGGGYGGAGGGTLNLIKIGSGTQTLSGANTYTGTTSVSAGTLALVGGSHTSPITLSSGASLGFTLGSPTTSTNTFNLTAGTIRITGTPSLPSHTLITASAGITGTPVLQAAIPGYALAVDGTSLRLVRVLSYAIWAATNAPTGTASDDADGDGVANGLEYALGGTRLTRDLTRLPRISQSGANTVVSFNRNQSSIDGATTLAFEVGTSLLNWPNSFTVPTTAVVNSSGITVIKNSPAGFDSVTLTLPRGSDTKKFVRLKVEAR